MLTGHSYAYGFKYEINLVCARAPQSSSYQTSDHEDFSVEVDVDGEEDDFCEDDEDYDDDDDEVTSLLQHLGNLYHV